MVLMEDGTTRRITPDEATSGVVTTRFGVASQTLSSASSKGRRVIYGVSLLQGAEYTPGAGTFKSNFEGLTRLAVAGRTVPVVVHSHIFRRVDDFRVVPLSDYWESVQIGTQLTYVVQTSTEVVQRCILMATDPGDLVLDPTCGSGTTAYVAEQWGRRWITIDTSRVALALARSRVMGARYPYYLLADSTAGREKGSRAHADRALRSPDRWRHPAGLRVRARTAHHPEVDRQQRRDRRDLGAVAGGAGAVAGGTERRAWPCVGGVGDPARGRRAVARAGNGSVETVAVGPVRCAESRRTVGFEQRSAPRLHP